LPSGPGILLLLVLVDLLGMGISRFFQKVNAAFADGSVRSISDQIDPRTLESMLIRDDVQLVESR
jgi:prepilin-type processing-associated H-X9-DG protein